MFRLNTSSPIGQAGKVVTPLLAVAADRVGALKFIDLAASYLNLVVGKGCGTGWDDGEQVAIARIIAQLNPSDPVVIDCGANHGDWTNGVRHHCSDIKGTWIAVEPDGSCVASLRMIANLDIIQAAVGEEACLGTLYTNESGSGLASLHKRQDTFVARHTFAATSTQVITLDSIIADRNLPRVDFLKLDVEGNELFALKGAIHALERGTIRALSFEFGSSNVNSRTFFRDFWDLLSPLGFSLKRICPGGSIMPIDEYYEDLEHFRGVSNYVGIRANS